MGRARAGVVGAGVSDLSHMRALRQLPQVDAAAVADRPLHQAQAAAEHVRETTCFNDHNTTLRHVMLDAIHD